jgi:hypothetical protein
VRAAALACACALTCVRGISVRSTLGRAPSDIPTHPDDPVRETLMFFQSTTHSLLQASALLGLTTLAAASSNDPEAPPFLPTSSFAFGSAHSHDSTRPDAHAPIGVMADHVHEAGE